MKNTLLAILLITSVSVSAHMITGVPVLKGSLKTSIIVNTVSTTCKVKVDEVKNLLEEDSFGNPAYYLEIIVSLSGKDFKRDIHIVHDRTYKMTNLHLQGSKTMVKDLDYFSNDGARLLIKTDGRLSQISFPYGQQTINCKF